MIGKKGLFYFFLAITIIYAGFIFALSSTSKPPGSEEGKQMIPYFHYAAHMALYFGFAYLVYNTLGRYPNKLGLDINIATIIISVSYGISDEVHQISVPGRYFSVSDIFFDFLGCILLLAFMWFIQRFKRTEEDWKR